MDACGVGCAVCCVGGGVCICTIILGIACGIFELVISPVSIPCSIYRQNKYNKWLDEWVSTKSNDEKNTVEIYCDGSVNYKAFNKKFKVMKIVSSSLGSNKADLQEAQNDIKLIPSCLIENSRYPWNFTPSKQEFFKQMDFFMKKIIHKVNLNADLQIEPNRLKELLISNIDYICPICLEDDNKLNIKNTSVTKCYHVFHITCLKSWTDQSNNTCPECRALLV